LRQDQQVFNIEHQVTNQQSQPPPQFGGQASSQRQYQGKSNVQGRTWNKNPRQRQWKQYYFFHGEEKGHVTRDCLDAKETQERIKNRTAQALLQPLARDVNHIFAPPIHQQYYPPYPTYNPNQANSSNLTPTYYPSFLPAWRSPSQPLAQPNLQRAEAGLTYINQRPPQLTYIEDSQPPSVVNRPHEMLPPPPTLP
jgi:hypothetical protein